jgi:hypothetical protein
MRARWHQRQIWRRHDGSTCNNLGSTAKLTVAHHHHLHRVLGLTFLERELRGCGAFTGNPSKAPPPPATSAQPPPSRSLNCERRESPIAAFLESLTDCAGGYLWWWRGEGRRAWRRQLEFWHRPLRSDARQKKAGFWCFHLLEQQKVIPCSFFFEMNKACMGWPTDLISLCQSLCASAYVGTTVM